MALKAEIQEAVKVAMKSGDKVALSTLRLVLSALHNEEIKLRKELTEQEGVKVLSTLCKQRTEAIGLFRKGGREELARKEEEELKVLERYMPQALSEEEVRALIREIIDELGARGVQDLGKVMKQVMSRVGGRSEGKKVTEWVKALLSA